MSLERCVCQVTCGSVLRLRAKGDADPSGGCGPDPETESSTLFAVGLPASIFNFFFQAEDGIRARNVTGVQTCALPISGRCHLQSPNLDRCGDCRWQRPGTYSLDREFSTACLCQGGERLERFRAKSEARRCV